MVIAGIERTYGLEGVRGSVEADQNMGYVFKKGDANAPPAPPPPLSCLRAWIIHIVSPPFLHVDLIEKQKRCEEILIDFWSFTLGKKCLLSMLLIYF